MEKGGLLLQSKEKKEATVRVGKFLTKQRGKDRVSLEKVSWIVFVNQAKKKGKRNGGYVLGEPESSQGHGFIFYF